MIEVLYIATNSYTAYAEGFLSTFKYFAPGRQKHLTILSNALGEYDGVRLEDGTKVNVVKMFDLLYPCINLHKSYFIEQLDFDSEYIFYFDADTMFKEVPDYDWDGMFADLDGNKVLISKHPVYSLKEGGTLLGWPRDSWTSNFKNPWITEKDDRYQAFISRESFTYTISSFFAANRETMHRVNTLIIKMNRNDLTRENGYHIPPYMDENYFNALTSDFEYGVINEGILFSIKQYSQLYDKDAETDFYPEAFIYQKNFPEHKTNRR